MKNDTLKNLLGNAPETVQTSTFLPIIYKWPFIQVKINSFHCRGRLIMQTAISFAAEAYSSSGIFN